jgi:hypothetical protein
MLRPHQRTSIGGSDACWIAKVAESNWMQTPLNRMILTLLRSSRKRKSHRAVIQYQEDDDRTQDGHAAGRQATRESILAKIENVSSGQIRPFASVEPHASFTAMSRHSKR